MYSTIQISYIIYIYDQLIDKHKSCIETDIYSLLWQQHVKIQYQKSYLFVKKRIESEIFKYNPNCCLQ